MSAWYVFSTMGFYPVNPADGKYVFGAPIIQEAQIALPNQKTFTVKVENQSTKNIYI
jgi:putative alpha-1,2-mannosidase